MIIPPINVTGKFTFSEPFNSILDTSQTYRVVSIRSLVELHNSAEEPCDTIYKSIGLTETDFKNDLNEEVPVIVLTNTGGDYIYVPANRIVSMPILNGYKYRGAVLGVDLGLMPLEYNFDLLKSVVADAVFDATGVRSTAEVIPSTAVTLLTDTEDRTFKRLLAAAKSTDKSYMTLYKELLVAYNAKSDLLNELTGCVGKTCTYNPDCDGDNGNGNNGDDGILCTEAQEVDLGTLTIEPGTDVTIDNPYYYSAIEIGFNNIIGTGTLRIQIGSRTFTYTHKDLIITRDRSMTQEEFDQGNWKSVTVLNCVRFNIIP